ncbi:MAG: spore coat protein CotJB [Clostridia bacterium]|nr:spore coat protein CotJB [Clostridia bacterium]
MTQKEMMEQIMALQFTLIDLGQYLDTHPFDSNAISYYNDYKEEWQKLWKEYEEKYEPLTAGSNNPTSWAWLDNPWPWENMFE